jgi:hypothetical protein
VYLVSTGLQDSIDFLVRHCSRSEPNPLAPRQAQTSLLECARGYFSSQEIDSHHATEHRSTDQSRNGCRMCCFCHAQRFEITRAKNKMYYLATFIQNGKVVEAFCHAACRLSNQCRPSIHQPPVDEFRVPAEMSIALSRAHLHARMPRRLVLAPRPPSRSPPTYDPHSTRCTAGCHTSRDFVPWRFLDAGQLSAPSVSSLPGVQKPGQKRSIRDARAVEIKPHQPPMDPARR